MESQVRIVAIVIAALLGTGLVGVGPGIAAPVAAHEGTASIGEGLSATALRVPAKTIETGRASMRDPKWGRLTVITSVRQSAGSDYPAYATLRVVDRRGRVRLARTWNWGYADIAPNKRAKDRTGNVFITYNPGRYNGVIVLRGAGGRIEDFGTLPPNDDYVGSGPFGYGAETVPDPTRRGVLAVKQSSNDCNPDCAGGTTTSKLYVWNGSGYILRAG